MEDLPNGAARPAEPCKQDCLTCDGWGKVTEYGIEEEWDVTCWRCDGTGEMPPNP